MAVRQPPLANAAAEAQRQQFIHEMIVAEARSRAFFAQQEKIRRAAVSKIRQTVTYDI